MGKLKYLSKNIALFSISNFVSKILVFLLVPLYTNVLTTYEYGIADIIQVTLLLLVPIITMNMGEAALRFGIENGDKRGNIFKISSKYLMRGSALVCAICLAASFFVKQEYRSYLLFFIFLFATNSLFEFLILFFQGCEMVNIVVIGSVFSTTVTIGCNILFLLVIKIGLYGYLLSQILAFLMASLLMIYLWKRSGFMTGLEYNDSLEAEMLMYSKPMMAYSVSSWANNAIDRYLVAGLCGAAVNGIYGVAYKIPAILMVFQRIFAQAWQMSATKTYDDEKSDDFFTGVFKAYNTFMIIGCGFLILFVRFVAEILFKKEFFEAWRFVPPLLISVLFGALTGFFSSICLAHKDSKSMGIASAVGAITNIILNICMIPLFGAMGAAVATGISYFIMALLAYLFVRKYTKLNINLIKCLIAYLLLVLQAVVMILRIKYDYIFSVVILTVLILMHINEVKYILGFIFTKISKRREEENV